MEQVILELRQGLSTETIQPRPNVENVRFDVMHARIMDALHKFNGAPFTIQRLCELLIDPKRHYKRSDKFMRGLEKNVLVVSTVDPFGRKVVSESSNKPLVNGMDINGSPFATRDPHTSTPLPPVPGWVTSTVAMASRSQGSPTQDSGSDQRQTPQVSSPESGITSNGVSSGLVSSLYADQGDQPLSVHAEEVVEETVVTMDTTDVANVAADGGESLTEEDEDEEMGGEDTNASSSSSSSSSSSEELSATEISENGTPSLSPKVSSSSETPQSRPWAVITDESETEQIKAGEGSARKSSDMTASEAVVAQESQDTSDSSSSSSSTSPPSSKLEEVSSPSSLKHESSSPAQSATTSTALSWQSISPTRHDGSAPDNTSSTNVLTQNVSEDSSGFDTVTISSTSADTSSLSAAAQTRVESADDTDLNNSGLSEQEPGTSSDSKTTSGLDSPASSTPVGEERDKCSSPSESDPNVAATVCSVETVASSTDILLPSYNQSSMECDSVAGLERLVGSVEPSSVSPISSQSAFSQLSSSLSSSPLSTSASHCHQTAASEEPVSSQSSDVPNSPPKTETAMERLEPEAADNSNLTTNSSSPTQSAQADSADSSEAVSSDSVVSSQPEESRLADSTENTAHNMAEDGTDSVGGDDVDGHVAEPAHDAGDGEVEAKEDQSSSPPSQRSSSDSMGFDMCGDSVNKSSGEDKMMEEESAVAETSVSSGDSSAPSAPDTCHEPMDQA